nr:alkane 1-monooxygenase [Mycobacterium sp.]
MADKKGFRAPRWRDAKRYLWLLGAVVPGLVGLAWLLVQLTGQEMFWWIGPLMAFIIIPALDHLVGRDGSGASENTLSRLQDDAFYRWVTYLYLPSQYLSLVFACWLWSGGGWLTMNWLDKAGLMVTVGIVGGTSINAAHELGHRRTSAERRLSKLALAQTGYGHFYVEHNRGHHVRVATVEDPASARLGEPLCRFIPRSILGGLRSAWRLESDRLTRVGKSRWTLHNEVLSAFLLTGALFIGLIVWFGPTITPWLIGQASIGVCLLESVNYLEHYGLRRQRLANGSYERIGPQHSWNSDTLIANVFLFHLQRHSDHHANPQRRYQTLRSSDQAPQLPYGYATMLPLAWCTPLWRRTMDRRVLAHYGGDVTLAALDPARTRSGAGRP